MYKYLLPSKILTYYFQQVLKCVNDGVKYLDERKDFWQQQKPVYARKAELMPATQKKKTKPKNVLASTIKAKSAMILQSAKVKW